MIELTKGEYAQIQTAKNVIDVLSTENAVLRNRNEARSALDNWLPYLVLSVFLAIVITWYITIFVVYPSGI